MLFFYYMFLHPHDAHITKRQLEGFDLAFIIYAEEEDFLPRAPILERQGAHPCHESIGQSQCINRPFDLVIYTVAQGVCDLAQHDRMAARILEEHKRHAEGGEAGLRGAAPTRKPVVRVAMPLHIEKQTVEARRN